jgi:cyclohexadienyl dehydratase
VALGPFTVDRKAALVHPNREELAQRLDAWLLARERDGTLAALREEQLGEGPWVATAEPLAALLAAVDERLSLMPLVGFVKRDTGVPLVVPEREAFVLDAASEAVLEAASRGGRMAPPLPMIRAFYRAQMEAAKQIQIDATSDTDFQPASPLPDLDGELRPALVRIGAKLAPLILELPPEGQSARVAALAETCLREPRLASSSRRGIVDAIVALLPSQARAKARASSPAATGSATQTP